MRIYPRNMWFCTIYLLEWYFMLDHLELFRYSLLYYRHSVKKSIFSAALKKWMKPIHRNCIYLIPKRPSRPDVHQQMKIFLWTNSCRFFHQKIRFEFWLETLSHTFEYWKSHFFSIRFFWWSIRSHISEYIAFSITIFLASSKWLA